MRRLAILLFTLSALLLTGAACRDRFDQWVAGTDLPPLVLPASVQVLDREGRLLAKSTATWVTIA